MPGRPRPDRGRASAEASGCVSARAGENPVRQGRGKGPHGSERKAFGYFPDGLWKRPEKAVRWFWRKGAGSLESSGGETRRRSEESPFCAGRGTVEIFGALRGVPAERGGAHEVAPGGEASPTSEWLKAHQASNCEYEITRQTRKLKFPLFMKEKVRRLTPRPETLRELFVKSGNQCAFPECHHPVVNSAGTYIANLCHIEAAEQGGQRFNEKQTNEQRRKISNLMLLCYRHHVETNDVSAFDVSRMKKIKELHEKKFAGLLSDIGTEVVDLSKLHQPLIPTELNEKASAIFDDFDAPEDSIIAINRLVEKLQRAAPAVRQVYRIIVERAGINDPKVSFDDLMTNLSTSPDEKMAAITLLELYGLCSDDQDPYRPDRVIHLTDGGSDWGYPVALYLKDFCQETGTDLGTMLVELDFGDMGKL